MARRVVPSKQRMRDITGYDTSMMQRVWDVTGRDTLQQRRMWDVIRRDTSQTQRVRDVSHLLISRTQLESTIAHPLNSQMQPEPDTAEMLELSAAARRRACTGMVLADAVCCGHRTAAELANAGRSEVCMPAVLAHATVGHPV
jgi:hypothetical protein